MLWTTVHYYISSTLQTVCVCVCVCVCHVLVSFDPTVLTDVASALGSLRALHFLTPVGRSLTASEAVPRARAGTRGCAIPLHEGQGKGEGIKKRTGQRWRFTLTNYSFHLEDAEKH